MQNIEPATGWATIDCGNPQPARKSLDTVIDFGEKQAWWSDAEVARHTEMMFDRHRRQVEALCEQGGAPVALTAFRRVREGLQRMEVRFDGIAGCLRTSVGGSSRQSLMFVDGDDLQSRLLSTREAARLMGLPESYRLPVRYNQAYHLLGDGVAAPVVRHLAAHLLEPLTSAS